MNKISIAGGKYSDILRQKFTLYFTLSCPLFKNYMKTRRSYWEEYKDFTSKQLRAMALKKYNNLITSGMWSTRDPKGAHRSGPEAIR